MYNLLNLNDYEFEILCKDIMEKKLNVTLHRFGKGKDGGIDLCDSNVPLHHMIQVKHYARSKYSNLKSVLKTEILKVEKEKPLNYYLCCSIELSPQQRKEIFSLFSKYMKNMSHIIDKTDIDDFLALEENLSTVEKNYKLWLCSTNILSIIQNQNIFIDCYEIISDIEKYTKLFVTTKSYIECQNRLLQQNIIIITGAPGVGKSTISKMLLLFFANNNYSVRYVTDNNIKDIKNTLSKDPLKKEIILLDDFLGQHYLKLKDRHSNELKSLISFVEKSSNKKMIMNSRITIINEAYSSSIDFENLFDTYEENKYLIDLDNMSDLEKAQILYNHLYFYNLPNDYWMTIKDNRNYALLVKHRNYNPRIIEYVTKPKNYNRVLPTEYVHYISNKLDNPDSVWEDEFRNRLEEIDRILLNTLYSLTDDVVDIDVLESAFNKRLLASVSNTTLNIFEQVIRRLNKSLIKINVDKRKRYVSVINPSVNDYLKKKIEKNIVEQITIINNAEYVEQIIKFDNNKNLVIENIYNGRILNLASINKNSSYYFFNLLLDYQIKDLKIKVIVEKAFISLCQDYYILYEDLIIELIEKEYVKFYNLEKIIFDNIEDISMTFSYDNLLILLNWIKLVDAEQIINKQNILYNGFRNAIIEEVIDSINADMQEIIESNIKAFEIQIEIPIGGNEEDLVELYIKEYYSIIKDDIIQEINNRLKEILDNTPLDLNLKSIDYNPILYNIDIKNAIKSYVENECLESHIERIENPSFPQISEEWEVIDKMFSNEK